MKVEIKPSVAVSSFGKTKDGQKTKLYRLEGAGGVVLEATDFGARIVRLLAPDRDGRTDDIVLGFPDVSGYENLDRYFGATIGRCGNRIASGKFTLDGKSYSLPLNNDPGGIPCSLHGGDGFDSRVWASETLKRGEDVGVRFTLTSEDGDQGYPGKVDATVTYWLTASNIWRIEYEAVTDKATPVNMTNHVYFNLKGEGNGTILDHFLTVFSDKIAAVDKGLIPTGQFIPVRGTPFDFTVPSLIGSRIGARDEQLINANGYDHSWLIRDGGERLVPAADLYCSETGRLVEVWTSEPAIQCYTGNFISDKIPAKRGNNLCKNGGIAMETQHLPDSPNHPDFPPVILRPGALYKTVTEYRINVK